MSAKFYVQLQATAEPSVVELGASSKPDKHVSDTGALESINNPSGRSTAAAPSSVLLSLTLCFSPPEFITLSRASEAL